MAHSKSIASTLNIGEHSIRNIIIVPLTERHATKEATVYVIYLDMFIVVQFSDDAPAVLSLGTLYEERVDVLVVAKKEKHLSCAEHGKRIDCRIEKYTGCRTPYHSH